MRRALVLSVLLLMMLGVRALTAGVGGVAADPLTLAAIGFVVLAAFTISELGTQALSLPRVTGYILAGIALGPSAANILSRTVVGEMRMFNSLALGLIATGAGLELDIKQLAKIWRLLTATVLLKVVLTVSMVAGAVIGLESALSLLGVQTQGQLWAIAAVLGALAVGTSPAISLAVINDARAKGPLSDLVLGAAIFKDVVLVVLMAVAVALSRGWLSGGHDAGHSIGATLLHELGGSLLAGSVLGALLIAYLRFVRAEMLLFVGAMILAVTEIGTALHLDLLLVFIVSGFIVRNFSRYTHELEHPLGLVALPVFVVFFTIAGAGIELAKVVPVLPFALALAGVRALSFWMTSHAAGALTSTPVMIRKLAWKGYLPQAGVTLGLLGLASAALPEVAHELSTLGIAVVATNLLLGPLALRRVLSQAGEVPSEALVEAPPATDGETAGSDAPAAPVARWQQVGLDEDLASHVAALREAVVAAVDAEIDHHIRPLNDSLGRVATEGVDAAADLGEFAHWLSRVDELGLSPNASAELFKAAQKPLRGRTAELSASIPESSEQPRAGEPRGVRWRKRRRRVARALGRGPRGRRIPLRALGLIHMEPRCAALAEQMVDLAARVQCALWSDLTYYLEGQLTREDARDAIEAHLTHFRQALESDARTLIDVGLLELSRDLIRVDTPEMPLSDVRYSSVAGEVEQKLSGLPGRQDAWTRVTRSVMSALRLRAQLLRAERAILDVVADSATAPAKLAAADLKAVLGAADEKLKEALARVDEEHLPREVLIAERDALAAVLLPERQDQLELDAAAFRSAASLHALAVSLRSVVDTLPEQLELADNQSVLRCGNPGEVRLRTVQVRAGAHRRLQDVLLPKLDSGARSSALALSTGASRARVALDVAIYALDEAIAAQPESRTPWRDELSAALKRAAVQLDAIDASLGEAFRAGLDAMGGAVTAELDQLGGLLRSQVAQTGLRVRRNAGARIVDRAQASLDRGVQVFRTRARKLATDLRKVLSSTLPQELQQRYASGARDVASIREYASRWLAEPLVEADYTRLFDIGPIHERRLFTARESELAQLIETERAWLDGSSVGSVLVVGSTGSGRTSLLNLAGAELGATRVLRPEPVRPRHDVGPLSSLAFDLGCRDSVADVAHALASCRTTVIFDDLEHWLVPTAKGMRELERFLDLMARTRGQVFWIATVTTRSLELLDGLAPVRHAFGKLLRLEPLRPDAARMALEARHALSGRDLLFEGTAASRLFGRFRQRGDAAVFYRVLTGVCGGNLRRMVCTWLAACKQDDTGAIVVAPNRALQLTLPAMHQLPATMLAVLASLDRFGPVDREHLSTYLRISRSELERHLAFLLSAGLLEPARERPDQLMVPAALRVPVAQELQEGGL